MIEYFNDLNDPQKKNIFRLAWFILYCEKNQDHANKIYQDYEILVRKIEHLNLS
jgi:hypothetical protein